MEEKSTFKSNSVTLAQLIFLHAFLDRFNLRTFKKSSFDKNQTMTSLQNPCTNIEYKNNDITIFTLTQEIIERTITTPVNALISVPVPEQKIKKNYLKSTLKSMKSLPKEWHHRC